MEYAGLAILVAAPVAATVAAYVTAISRLVLMVPLIVIAIGFWIAYGWLDVAGLDIARWAAASLAALYAFAWLVLCHLLVAAGRALRLRRGGGG
jgi:hypothetical protein